MTSEESRRTLLRTSAEVAEHCGVQLGALVTEWPEYTADVERFAKFTERLSGKAQELGHVPTTGAAKGRRK